MRLATRWTGGGFVLPLLATCAVLVGGCTEAPGRSSPPPPATGKAATPGRVTSSLAPATPAPVPSVADTATTFSFAVVPDTQPEVGVADRRADRRVQWLLANRERLNLGWVLHSGDLQDWDTPDHGQWVAMSARFRALAAAGLPFVAAPGNHDTAAVCEGGSACPGADAAVTLRDTTRWNTYYPPSYFGFEGLAEPGKSDNGWRSFSAGGADWLVLSLELWPRREVVAWAQEVIAAHRRHNVIVLTHMFLDEAGGVSQSNGGYGETSPARLWDVLDDHPNVVMTFSGHTGQVVNTTMPAADGHRVAMFLQAMHAPDTNPVRIVTVDTAAGTVSTEVRVSFDRSRPQGQQDVEEAYPYSTTISGMRWVRPAR